MRGRFCLRRITSVLLLLIFGVSIILSPSTLFSSAQNSSSLPIWAFNGAFTNYTLTETVANSTVDSGWESFMINSVNSSSGIFNMTTQFFDSGRARLGQGVVSGSLILSINRSLGFSALSSSDLNQINQGKIPGRPSNESIVTSVLLSVKAGAFQGDQLASPDGSVFLWVDSFSGVVLKSGATIQNPGSQSAEIQSELSSTNIPMSSTPPFNTAWIYVSAIAGIFTVVGLALGFERRRQRQLINIKDVSFQS